MQEYNHLCKSITIKEFYYISIYVLVITVVHAQLQSKCRHLSVILTCVSAIYYIIVMNTIIAKIFAIQVPSHLTRMHSITYRIRTNIGGYNIWRFVEIMDLARY